MQRFREGQTLGHPMPLAGVPVLQEIKTIPADVVQPGEGRVKLRGQGSGIIRAIAREEPVLVAVPLALDGDRRDRPEPGGCYVRAWWL